MYKEIASSIDTEALALETLVSDINAIPMSNGWHGSASVSMLDGLTGILENLKKQSIELQSFAQILFNIDEYKKGKEKLEELKEYYYSIPKKVIYNIKRKNLEKQINDLITKLSDLKNDIIAKLKGVEPLPKHDSSSYTIDENNVNKPTDNGLKPTNPNYDGSVLTPSKGRSKNGPQAEETWYDLNMGYVTERMDTVYGIPIETWVDPNTGVKMCRRKGESASYVMVAADVHNVWGGRDRNPNATYSMGDVVLTSWGPGMIVDYCGEAVQYREQGRNNRFDIATAWGSGYYGQGQAYAEEANRKRNQG